MNSTPMSDRPTLVRSVSSPGPEPPRDQLSVSCLAFGLVVFASVVTAIYNGLIPILGLRLAFDLTFGLLLLLLSPLIALHAGIIVWCEDRWGRCKFQGVGFAVAGFVLVLLSVVIWLGYMYLQPLYL